MYVTVYAKYDMHIAIKKFDIWGGRYILALLLIKN